MHTWLDVVAIALAAVGALNWALVAADRFDLVDDDHRQPLRRDQCRQPRDLWARRPCRDLCAGPTDRGRRLNRDRAPRAAPARERRHRWGRRHVEMSTRQREARQYCPWVPLQMTPRPRWLPARSSRFRFRAPGRVWSRARVCSAGSIPAGRESSPRSARRLDRARRASSPSGPERAMPFSCGSRSTDGTTSRFGSGAASYPGWLSPVLRRLPLRCGA